MRIELLVFPTDRDWLLCRQAALVTAGAVTDTVPTLKQKCALLDAEHSPIRLLRFVFRIRGMPYYVSTHLARHHVGCTPFIRSQRNDRQDAYDRNAARQDAPVDMMWEVNAQGLIDMAHRRLCGKADPVTRELVEQLCAAVVERCPEFRFFLVPMCVYRGGCHELSPCGRGPVAERPWEREVV